jgi:hypothetical protein
MATLRVFDAQGQLGTITLDGGRLTGSTRSIQVMADSAVRKAGGDAAEAFRTLDGWSNGYVWAKP